MTARRGEALGKRREQRCECSSGAAVDAVAVVMASVVGGAEPWAGVARLADWMSVGAMMEEQPQRS